MERYTRTNGKPLTSLATISEQIAYMGGTLVCLCSDDQSRGLVGPQGLASSGRRRPGGSVPCRTFWAWGR